MSLQAAFTLFLLLATLIVMGSQRLRADLVALIVMTLLIVSGIVDPLQAFAAFGQPVIIIVACVYVLGAALSETGVANIIAGPILRIGGRGTTALLLVIILIATALTAVLDGMLVVALLLPAVLRIARTTGISRSVLLLPLATAATLGSHLTLIGASSNLVVSDVLAASGEAPLGLLSLTPYAAVVMVLMTLWFLGPGRKLLDKPVPEEQTAPSLGEVATAYGLDNQLYLLRVRSESSLVGYRLDAVSVRARFGLNILALQSARDPLIMPARPDLVLEQDDLLYVQSAPGELHQAANRLALEVKRPAALAELAGVDEEALRMAEVMIPVRSPLIGKTLQQAGLRARHGVSVLVVQRQSEVIRDGLGMLRLAAGDTLLVEGRAGQLRTAVRDLRLVAATDLGPLPGDVVTAKARLTIAIVAGLVVVVALNLMSLAVASVVAVLLLILTGCISAERAYRSIDGSVLVLIGAMLSLSLALEQTGAAGQIAFWISAWSQSAGPLLALFLLYLLTSIITQVVANAVAAALVTPIAVGLATTMGASPQLFAIAMAFAVATAYITPLTDGDNLLVREPGRYTMRDYVVNGLPLWVLETAALFVMFALHQD
jgi:di/tricarboxylate transporter